MQPKGWEKYLIMGLPVTSRTITCRLERVPGLERTEKVAPVSRRKSTGFPSTSRITQGSGVLMVRWDRGATVRSPGPHQSWMGVWLDEAGLGGRGLWGQPAFQWSPLQMGQGCGGFGPGPNCHRQSFFQHPDCPQRWQSEFPWAPFWPVACKVATNISAVFKFFLSLSWASSRS